MMFLPNWSGASEDHSVDDRSARPCSGFDAVHQNVFKNGPQSANRRGVTMPVDGDRPGHFQILSLDGPVEPRKVPVDDIAADPNRLSGNSAAHKFKTQIRSFPLDRDAIRQGLR